MIDDDNVYDDDNDDDGDGDDVDDDDDDDDVSDTTSTLPSHRGVTRRKRATSRATTPLVQIVRNPDLNLPYKYLGVNRLENLMAIMTVQREMDVERDSLLDMLNMDEERKAIELNY